MWRRTYSDGQDVDDAGEVTVENGVRVFKNTTELVFYGKSKLDRGRKAKKQKKSDVVTTKVDTFGSVMFLEAPQKLKSNRTERAPK